MKFNFPQDRKTETLNISIYEKDIKKIRKLAEINKCTINDIYKTLISEALEEYEEQFGRIEQKDGEKRYSVKRDFIGAGDNRRKEIIEEDPGSFDGGGDQRTREEKAIIAAHYDLKKKADAIATAMPWATGHSSCASCHTTERKHIGRGLCSKCYYHATRSERTKDSLKEKSEKLPKDWYKEENLKRETEIYLYCANPNCKKYKFGKFVRGREIVREGKTFCSEGCADEVSPIRQPLPENFVWAYCQYILCDVKKYLRSEGVEAEGKNFCSEKHYAAWLQSIKHLAFN